MNRSSLSAVSLLLASSIMFNAGCASSRDGRVTQAQGTGIGAVGGAALGALFGAASGDSNNIAKYAGVGAVAGGAAGFAYGTRVANRKAKYVKAEDWLDQEIALARSANNKAHAYNNSLKKRVASLDRQVAAARAAGDRAAMKSLKREISQVGAQAQQQDKSEAQTVSDQKFVKGDANARNASNYGEFQREANGFAGAQAERGKIINHLASLDNSLDR